MIDWTKLRTPEGARREVERDRSPDLAAQTLALWPTPTSLAPAKNGNNEAGNSAGLVAIRAHALARWPTARSCSAMAAAITPEAAAMAATRPPNLESVIGAMWHGSSATTEKPGALNPQFVCWLMGFPPEWDACAPTAMPSSRKSRQK